MPWERVDTTDQMKVERLAVPGGWLYWTASFRSRNRRPIESVTFVPEPAKPPAEPAKPAARSKAKANDHAAEVADAGMAAR